MRGLLRDVGERGSALIIRGPAGIGKSTLVDDARATAIERGFRVLTCAGVQRESSSGLAGLQQLLHVVVDRADDLPDRQREALHSVFGLGPATAPDRLVLSLAVLGLLEDLAQQQPLLLIVEDVQWMDGPTAGLIGFVGRRVRDTAIVMLVTCRSDEADAVTELGLPEMPVGRLADGDATALLAALDPGMRREVRDRILDEAEGNPLALVELSRGLMERGLHDTAGLPARLPIGARLENVFADQAAQLPRPAQDLLLLAAAGDAATLTEIGKAARLLGIDAPEQRMREAAEAGLVRPAGDELTFRHPLIRSAVYGAAPFPRRIAAHRALAEVFAGDPERSAWHRSAGTVGRDETVARDLETAAGLAAARGVPGSAMRYLERAAELSPDPGQAARRLARAADAARQSGVPDAAARLIAAARKVADPLVAAELAVTESFLAFYVGGEVLPIDRLIEIARRTAAVDRDLAVTLLLFAAIRCRHEAPASADGERILDRLRELGLTAADPSMTMATAYLAPTRDPESLLAAVRAAAGDMSVLPLVYANGLGAAADALHDWVLAGACWTVAVEGYRRAGALADLASIQIQLARNLMMRGRLADAALTADEARRHGADLGLPLIATSAEVVAAQVAVWRGDAESVAAVHSDRADLRFHLGWARGLSALSASRPAEALAELLIAADHPDLGPLVVADLAEAASRAGDTGRAALRLEALADQVRPFRSALLEILVECGRGLLAGDGDHAEEHFRAAIGPPAVAADFPLQVARTRLVHGEWLRRRRRTSAARDEFAAAAAAFDLAGALPWAARARAELRATGVAVDAAAGQPAAALLTAQELQIARLAAQGRTNKEIADQLFLSHRTVGAHLYRVFPKLGITSRAALAGALGEAT
ncbi:AAA ATPase domain-containing protein [Actinoplanes philippinensis]|uniref:AAA ATPase domain-containing protein n=1 Tax=Actinoplanes philippinensis TaxID=35752 RepID=A0A1I2GF99_9ACTN|nr:AAA ATPase domain-containing protein [Actinoplanes philippinensis]